MANVISCFTKMPCVFIVLSLLRSVKITSEALEAYVVVVLLFLRMLYKRGQSLNALLTISRSQLKRGENVSEIKCLFLASHLGNLCYVGNFKLIQSGFLVLSTVFGLSCMLKELNHS